MKSKHLICALIGGVAALALSGSAFAADASKLALPGDLTLAQAGKVVAAAEAKAQQQGTLMNIAVIDAGGNLKAFARMDGAFLGSIDIALKKAKTARFFNMSSKELGDLSQPGKPLYGIEVTNDGLVIFGGGELIRDKSGTIIGAIGVSGSSVEDDMGVAQAGAAGL
jgi:uncharacterized protein GlcG (DUF336 family)